MVVGVVSPGAMGSALGRAWASGGSRVVATLTGRSQRTARLATGLELVSDLEAVVRASDVVVSVCPPGAAEAVLTAVIATAEALGARPLLVDANAVSPAHVEHLARLAATAGLGFVDGAISGGPPVPHSSTMLYLSGARAAEVADLPAVGLGRRIVGERPGQASAVKMCTASVYKGSTAIWSQAIETADRLGVLEPVLDDLAPEFADQVATVARRIAVAASKSRRFVDEMESIAVTQGSAGASSELFEGMAAVYRRLSDTPLAALTPEEAAGLSDLREVLERLRG